MNPEDLPLRDIHLPPDIGSWPPGPGWWVVAILLLIGIAVLVWWMYRSSKIRRSALRALKTLERDYDRSGDAHTFVAGLSVLLRRVALSRGARAQVASLHDEAWLQWLDQDAPDKPFSLGAGRVLTELPYQRPPVALGDDLERELPSLARRFILGGKG